MMIRNTLLEARHQTKKNKVIVLLIFFSIFLVGTISAFGFNNKLIYSENDLKINLTNWFGLGEDYGSAELKSHPSVDYVKQVLIGNPIVMWYDFDFNNIYINGIGKIYFTDIKTGKEIIKNYSFVYWGNESYEESIYTCESFLNVNGTQRQECFETGTKTTKTEKWISYNSSNIPKGKIRIGIVVNIGIEETIDVVWTIGGKKVTKHAVVTSGATKTIDGNYTIATYLNNGTFNTTEDLDLELLVVAGGGAGYTGGDPTPKGGAGGGGAGEFYYNASYNLSSGNYNVTVGVRGVKYFMITIPLPPIPPASFPPPPPPPLPVPLTA